MNLKYLCRRYGTKSTEYPCTARKKSQNSDGCRDCGGALNLETDSQDKVKTCIKCGQTMGISEFYRKQRNKDGYSPRCKVCDGKNRRRKPVKAAPVVETWSNIKQPESLSIAALRKDLEAKKEGIAEELERLARGLESVNEALKKLDELEEGFNDLFSCVMKSDDLSDEETK